jgi:hypothetical protein
MFTEQDILKLMFGIDSIFAIVEDDQSYLEKYNTFKEKFIS